MQSKKKVEKKKRKKKRKKEIFQTLKTENIK